MLQNKKERDVRAIEKTDMDDIKNIAKDIYKICYEVDKNITGLPDKDAELWAKANSIRHAHTIKELCDQIKNRKGGRTFRILNASGLSSGHQDFSIMHYLLEKEIKNIEWTAYESPKSNYLKNNLFNEYIDKFKIRISLVDFAQNNTKPIEETCLYDLILFTEIIEHLDHTVMLRTLKSLSTLINSKGILIVTTPNFMSLTNRFRILLGNGDGPYWGDGQVNMEQELYGHIVSYDINRLVRILRDSGYAINKKYTFSYGRGPSEKYIARRIIYSAIDAISKFIRYSDTAIFISASKGETVKILFEV